MPEDYFLYFEDVELCWTANRSGGEVWYVPDSVITHVHDMDSVGRSSKALFHHLVSIVRYFMRHPSALRDNISRRRQD